MADAHYIFNNIVSNFCPLLKLGISTMSKAQVIHKLGPPSAMNWQDWHVPDPAPGEVRLRHTAVGVNFAD